MDSSPTVSQKTPRWKPDVKKGGLIQAGNRAESWARSINSLFQEQPEPVLYDIKTKGNRCHLGLQKTKGEKNIEKRARLLNGGTVGSEPKEARESLAGEKGKNKRTTSVLSGAMGYLEFIWR